MSRPTRTPVQDQDPGPPGVPPSPSDPVDSLIRDFLRVRRASTGLCSTLEPEDFVLQSMPDASPAKWHLAHTTWFFEEFILSAVDPGYRTFHPRFSFLFNSYYNAVGERIPRPRRGLLSRPTVREALAYRESIDERMVVLLRSADPSQVERFAPLVVLGLNHEQQHQELLLTDLKHALWHNPLRPAFRDRPAGPAVDAAPRRWISYPEGVRWIGHGGDGFAFDNEGPRHRQFVEAFRVASRPATSGEFLEFIADGGYDRPDHWLSDGWAAVQQHGWRAPLYWERGDDGWSTFTLAGMRPVDPAEPACHVSYYEADAFARWSGCRLLTEAEWETAADVAVSGNFADDERFHPAPPAGGPENEPAQVFGDVWEWTASAYLPYPGFRPAKGAVGEYNGKFMCNQHVLRGGSCATPRSHIRPTYRNFFYPDARWQFSGVRLAQVG
ncbi:ergothioneine biosynthesis protein EgtB [Tautonia plasticadhaerens]|uniref:Iron(II)-dependent oxidoreductase EgtB n=1 Tax=Tautonia plasticadhaerens TaxID=2527974 RepID=A0A518HBP5_9BACT|nr:ergothioneine biosynthesis protein EgtB [Tautonia plasticadhaerens]QDV38269.1 Iron(II)-dependent oxidoreductase EgtB [Tautonia plasticadhaerens]